MKNAGIRKSTKTSGHKTILSAETLKQHSWKFMYHLPPTEELTIENFEKFALDRLKMLKNVENFRLGQKEKFVELVKEQDKKTFGDYDTSEKDFISHHILRLSFAKNENQRNWFVSQEVSLFETRLKQKRSEELVEILNNNGIQVENVSSTEKQKIIEDVKKLNFSKMKDDDIWKVKWQNVLNLISTRRVLISRGFAYLTSSNLNSLIVQNFKEKLQKSLSDIQKLLPYLEDEENERLVPFLTKLGNKNVGNEYRVKSGGDSYGPQDIDGLAKQSFPLCMKHLHKKLKQTHHIKHQGRLQYGLFLKGIGLTLDGALQYWRDEFTKKMTDSDFDKNYLYGFRHQYGQEGKKTNYSPYGCTKIILGAFPTEGDFHGCPFKHFDEKTLRNELKSTSSVDIEESDIDEIVQLTSQNHYQLACRKYFEISHSFLPHKMDINAVKHPNQYFDQSIELYKSKEDDKMIEE
eukprot:gene2497-3203_t